MEAPYSNSHFEKTFLLVFFSLVFTKVVCVVFSNVFVLFRFWIWMIKLIFFLVSSPFLTIIFIFILVFPLVLLSFASYLLSCCYLLIFLPCATSNYCLICCLIELLPHYLVLLPHHTALCAASLHYLVIALCTTSLLCHITLLPRLVALSHYLTTPPHCPLPCHATIAPYFVVFVAHCFIGSLNYLLLVGISLLLLVLLGWTLNLEKQTL